MKRAEAARRLGARIRLLRTERGLSQARLAEMVDSYRTIVCRVESGRHMPSIETVLEYAEALDANPSDILSVLDGGAP